MYLLAIVTWKDKRKVERKYETEREEEEEVATAAALFVAVTEEEDRIQNG